MLSSRDANHVCIIYGTLRPNADTTRDCFLLEREPMLSHSLQHEQQQ